MFAPGKNTAFGVDSANYYYTVCEYGPTGDLSDGTGYLGQTAEWTDGMLILNNAADKFVINFQRKDGANMAAADEAAIAAGLRFYRLTDTGLSREGAPADARAVHDALLAEDRDDMLWQTGWISSENGANRDSSNAQYRRTAAVRPVKKAPLYLAVDGDYAVTLMTYSAAGALVGGQAVTAGQLPLEAGQGYRLWFQRTDEAVMTDDETANVRVFRRGGLQELYDRQQDTGWVSFSMFEKFAVLGDSFASGSIHHVGGESAVKAQYRQLSWPKILARMYGAQATLFSQGGLSVKTWLDPEKEHGITAFTPSEAQQLYICAFGINDAAQISDGTLTLGSAEDIKSDYTQNPDTFYGDYGRIIGLIKAKAPTARIVLLSVARPGQRRMDVHIRAIAQACGVPFIDLTDSPYFVSAAYEASFNEVHPLAYGYAGMATAIAQLMSRCILENTVYFQNYDGDAEGEPDPEGV